MPSLSERDLRSVEKLFNAIQPILTRSRNRQLSQNLPADVSSRSTSHGDASASVSLLSPSAELKEGLSLYSASTQGGLPQGGLDNDAMDQRLWTELGFAIWRVGQQKLHLMNFVALDPLATLSELAFRLADYLKSVYTGTANRLARLLLMARLSSSHVVTLLQLFCAQKTCIAMLNGEVEDGKRLHESVCAYLTVQGHLGWMSQLYVNFCDEAAARDASAQCMPTIIVVALREVLECLRICAEQSKVAANAFITAEPIAYVTYLFYGLKLRLSKGALLRPHESDDKFWIREAEKQLGMATTSALGEDNEDAMAHMAVEAFRSVGIPLKRSSAAIVPSKYFSRIVRADLVRSVEAYQDASASMVPVNTAGASRVKEVSEMLRSTIPDAYNVSHPLTDDERAQLTHFSAPSGGTSSALNRGGLSRAQMHQLIAFGRLNCFDELTHHALDVMVEAVCTTNSYAHFTVHSTLSNFFALSVRGMQTLAEHIHATATTHQANGSEARDVIASRFVTGLLAHYENVITIGHVFLVMADSLKLKADTTPSSLVQREHANQSTEDSRTTRAAEEEDDEQAVDRIQEERELFMQRMLKDELTSQMRTVIYTAPSLLRCDPMLFAIIEKMCRLGVVSISDANNENNTNSNNSRTGYMDASGSGGGGAAWSPRQGSRAAQGGTPPVMRRTPNDSFQRLDGAAGLGSGRPPLGGPRPLTNTSMAMGSFFFGPHQGSAAGPAPLSSSPDGVGSGSRRRRLPVPTTRPHREASPLGAAASSASGKDSALSSSPKDSNFAKSFFKSFFGRKGPSANTGSASSAAETAPASHPAQLLENSTSTLDTSTNTRHPYSGMGPSRPSLSEFDGLLDDAAAAEERTASPRPARPQANWADVPSYVTFVRGHVELLLTVLEDSRLNVYVRIAAGLVLSAVTFADANSFDLYEGRVGVRAMLKLITDALRRAQVEAPAAVAAAGASGSFDGSTAVAAADVNTSGSRNSPSRRHGQQEDARTTANAMLGTLSDSEELIPAEEVPPELNAHDELTTAELISLVTNVVRLLKKVYFVIGVSPLTSEAVLLTELPLSFFAETETQSSGHTAVTASDSQVLADSTASADVVDGHGGPAVNIKAKRLLESKCLEDVLQLWSNAVDLADCDEDMDAASFRVLEILFHRALQRGALPTSGTGVGGGATGPVGAGMGSSGHDGANQATSSLSVTDVRRAAGATGSSGNRRGLFSPLATAPSGIVSFLNNSLYDEGGSFFHDGYPSSPGFGTNSSNTNAQGGFRGAQQSGARRLPLAPGGHEVDVLGENKTADHLIDIFEDVVHRCPSLINAKILQTLFDCFSAHEAGLTRLGRHCLVTTFDCGESYEAYANLIRDEHDGTVLVHLLGLMARDLQGEDMSEERLHERRVWMLKSHFINELILRLCATLEAPHRSPLFVKLVPQTLRLLCAFEPSRETSPHLDDTCFLSAVSEAIGNMEGTEYFLIVAQSVIDAATSSFDSVGTYLTGQSAALMTGPLHIMHGKWYAEKQTFLDLVPALASWTLEHDLGLYQCLVEVVTGMLKCTSNVNSARLVEFALGAGLSQWVPFLEMPPASVSQLPFVGDPTYLRHFWTPVLANAPQRSDIRYAMTGGVRLSVGRWPERGFTISALFKFDALYPTISLFELQSNETAEMAERPVMVEVVSGDSMQVVYDGYRTTLNESHALQNFRAAKWLPVTLVFSVANTLTAFIGGFRIGSAAVPYFDPGTTATVSVGFVNKIVPTSLFSLSDIAVWDDELTAGQVEAHLAYMCLTDGHPGAAKVPEFAIPYAIGGHSAVAPVDDCIAHYVPYEHSDGLLTNLLNTESRYPLLAKIIGRNAVTPQYWVNYYQLFISRGGAYSLLDWLRRCTTSDEVVEVLELLVEALRRTNTAEMERPFLYLRLAHHLKQIAPLITTRVWDVVLYGATSHVIINDEEHRIAINRYLFEFILANMELHNDVDDDVTLYLLERLEKVFNPSMCRYARHNATFIYAVRFVDRLLNSLVLVANETSIPVRAATIACAKQVVIACDMDESLVHCLTSLIALLTPSAITMTSQFSPALEVTLPVVRHVRTTLSVLAAQSLTTLLLRSLVECATTHATFMTAFCRVIDFSWYAVCVGRFADPVAVVYATKLFFDAVQRSPALLEDVLQHQASIVEALRAHAIHDDLSLFLLSLTIGCSRQVDLLAQNHSLLQQLDGVLNSCTPEPNAVVAPIFVKIFVHHLGAVVRTPHFLPYPVNTVHQRHRYNAYRIRKYFKAVFFCCRLMMLINMKRYRMTLRLDLRRLRERGGGAGVTQQQPATSPRGVRRQASETPALDGSVSALDMTLSGPPMAAAGTTPLQGPAATGHSSPRRSQNHSFTLSFAGGAPTSLFLPRMPVTDQRATTSAGFLAVPGLGTASGLSAGQATPSQPFQRQISASNTSFASEETGSFAGVPASRPRVRSATWRRAFAALRVCVLLWIPIQCRRYRWVFLRKQAVKPEQALQHRHPGTLFTLRALRRYSAQPSLFYVLVSSPLETAALASLLPYISKERLAERTQAWTEYLHKLGPLTLNQSTKATDASQPSTYVSTKLIAASEALSNASSESMTTTPTSAATYGRQTSFPVSHVPGMKRVLSSGALSDKSATHAPEVGNEGGDAQETEEGRTDESTEQPAANVTDDALDEPDTPGGRVNAAEAPLSQQARQLMQSAMMSLGDSFADLPPTVETTAVPERRKLMRPTIQVPNSAPLSMSLPTSPIRASTAAAATAAGSEQVETHSHSHTHSHAHSRSRSQSSHASGGSRSSSSSSSSSSNSRESSGANSTASSANMASRTTSLGNTLRDGVKQTDTAAPPAQEGAVSTAGSSMLISEATLIAMAEGKEPLNRSAGGASSPEHSQLDDSTDKEGLLPGAHVDHVDMVQRAVAAVGESTRQETVSVLSALIRSSLNVLPAQRWIGGPSYGSCGGLLFQLMFISSAATSSEDLSATLVRFFLVEVTTCVHEQQIAMDPASIQVGSPLIPSLSNSVMFDSARNSLSLRGVAAERGGAMGMSLNATANNSFQGVPIGVFGGLPSSVLSNESFAPGRAGVGPGANTNSNIDVLLFNVSHFTELVVDMLSINVLDLMTARDYLHGLLVLCHSWPARFVDQLSSQVMRACVAVLNRPSQNDVPVEMVSTIYELTKIVLRPTWQMKGMIECLLRVLYRVYTAFPPVYMSDEDAQRRKDLVVLTFRHIVQTYSGTKELHKALSVRTLTQRFSLYDAFKSTLLKGTDQQACAAFHAYCETHASAMETLMSGRPRQKADAAFRTTIKIRTEYIKRIKSFNQHYMAEVDLKPGHKPQELVDHYMGLCSSYAASVPRLLEEHLALLPIHNCSLPEMLTGEGFSLYHYMDMPRNFTVVPRPVQEKVPPVLRPARVLHTRSLMEEDQRGADSSGSDSLATPRTPHPQDADDVKSEALLNGEEEDSPSGGNRTRAPPLAEDLELRQAAVCEEQVNHVAALVPAFAVRSRPFLINGDRPPFIGENVVVTPSAINLLWYLLESDEVLRFMSNGFRINGLHATPCLILLTNRTLKVISFSRVTEAGDIVLCQNESDMADDDDTKSNASSAVLSEALLEGSGKGSGRSKRKQGFNILSMTRQLQRFLSDGKSAEKEQVARDGTRVAQAVRQSTSKAYSQLYWAYAARNMRQVRCLRYMHLNTAVLIKMYHDDAVFLSVVDSKQSMNPSVREAFLDVLRDVVKPHRCEFVDSSQRATDMRSMLIRWAAGSVSNYEYLSFLNRTAGRTVKDYNQYPVFPWVLADYVSSTLDLEKSSTFRDLRYPMGAQLEERREMVSDLFQNTSEILDPETGKSHPFHHGTHYSTSGGVLYFLLRAEPFATFARDFQGGNFDVATRLFDSIAASFRSCELGPADCKELLPEFFYNSNFLQNADHLDFGCKSDGEKVDNVSLPPWAKGSVQVFTAVMRYALESDYVTHNIHNWIDLVFGVRRRGPLAVERFNTFQRMTYGEEVAMALQHAQTPHDCDVIIAEVDNFGQTPLQLFQERHPSHMELEPVKKVATKDSFGTSFGSIAGSLGAAVAGSGGTAGAGSGVPAGASFASASAEFKPSTLLKASHNAYGGGADGRAGTRSGSLASGNTYTNAFKKETPKVMLMLVQALADPITNFELSEPSPQLFQPLPPSLVDRFRVKPAVLGFVRASGTQKIVCSYAYMVGVEDEDYFVCWHDREGRLVRCLNTDGSFLSVLPFRSPDDRTVRVSAVAVSPRESFVAVAVSNGSIYCFYPTLREDAVVQTNSLCFHHHAVRGISVDAVSGRAISYTTDALDFPVVWRVQRCHSGWMQRLDLSTMLPPREHTLDTDHDRTVVGAFVDPQSLMSVIATPRYLLLFDINGEPFGSGKVPGLVVRRTPAPLQPSTGERQDSDLQEPQPVVLPNSPGRVMLEDDDGTLGIAVSPTSSATSRGVPLKPGSPPEPDMTCITVYQCTEWAAGMQLYISGHLDGSIGLWRSTRLPPDTVQPGKIAVVEFHQMVIRGDGGFGAVTALWQDRTDLPHFFVGYADGSVKVFTFEEPSAKEDGGKAK